MDNKSLGAIFFPSPCEQNTSMRCTVDVPSSVPSHMTTQQTASCRCARDAMRLQSTTHCHRRIACIASGADRLNGRRSSPSPVESVPSFQLRLFIMRWSFMGEMPPHKNDNQPSAPNTSGITSIHDMFSYGLLHCVPYGSSVFGMPPSPMRLADEARQKPLYYLGKYGIEESFTWIFSVTEICPCRLICQSNQWEVH